MTSKTTKYQFDNYYQLIRKYFDTFSEHKHLQIDSEGYLIANNTVYTELEYIAVINGYLQVQVRNTTHGGWVQLICKLDLIQIRMLYNILKKKFGKL
jgi:hypothetical protein